MGEGWAEKPASFHIKRRKVSKSLISIIVPTLNCGEYLEALIKSVRIQMVEWELIVVDVGSQDKTKEIMEGFNKDRRIKYIRTDRRYNANIGRNIGLQVAVGEYVFIADADSHLGDNCLLKLKSKIDEGFDFAYCDFSVVEKTEECIKTGVHICGEWDPHRLCKSNYISIMSLWKKKIMPVIDNEVEKLQDWDMYLEAIEQSLSAGYVKEKLFTVWMREEGMSRNGNKSNYENLIREKRGI